MRNKLITISIGLILLLAGFALGVKYNNLTVDNINKGTQLSDSELFSKKKECQKYQNQIEEKLRDSDTTIPETGAQTYNAFDKIFYSSKANSCLYVSTETMFVNGKTTFETPTLRDALSGETLLSDIREPGTEDYFDRIKQFEAGVKEYE
ncbi:hypothetical protein HYV57_00380 [Candidatus Peregrinibacteria bacterium]|nr:hypothetical protein [Candidatus Peregrinibacteria bacterium]